MSSFLRIGRRALTTHRVHHVHFIGCGCEVIAQQLFKRTASRFMSTGASDRKPIGFIGLGNMGGYMAHNLLKAGYPLVVYDLNPAALAKVQAQAKELKLTATVAKTPREVGEQVLTCISMLPSSPHVRDVYTKADGILAGLTAKGALLIDSSTIDPQTARDVAAISLTSGATMVDAPVSGGVGGAEAGSLTFMVGGSDDAFARARPILAVMGKNIVHCGASGTGQVAKVCNNVVLGMSMAAVAEGMSLGVKLGMDPTKLAGIFNTSSARCWSSDTYNPCPGVIATAPASRGYTGGFGTALMHKDMGLATDAAKQIGHYMPLATVTQSMYADVMKDGHQQKDFSYIYEHVMKHKA